MTKTDEVLKACPGCGGTWANLTYPANGAAPYVLCKSCGWAGPQIAAASTDEQVAIAAWNTRASIQPADDAVVERVARAIHEAQWDEPYPKQGGVEHAMALQCARAAIAALASPQGEKAE